MRLGGAAGDLRELARLKTTLAVQKVGQRYRKLQDVAVKVAACAVKVKYRAGRGREEEGQTKQKEIWLVQVTREGLGGSHGG